MLALEAVILLALKTYQELQFSVVSSALNFLQMLIMGQIQITVMKTYFLINVA